MQSRMRNIPCGFVVPRDCNIGIGMPIVCTPWILVLCVFVIVHHRRWLGRLSFSWTIFYDERGENETIPRERNNDVESVWLHKRTITQLIVCKYVCVEGASREILTVLRESLRPLYFHTISKLVCRWHWTWDQTRRDGNSPPRSIKNNKNKMTPKLMRKWQCQRWLIIWRSKL